MKALFILIPIVSFSLHVKAAFTDGTVNKSGTYFSSLRYGIIDRLHSTLDYKTP